MGITTFPDFRELSFRNLRVWRWNFRVKWIFTERVSWVGILKEKSARKESGGLWRIRNQSPPASNSTYSPRTGTSLILCHMVVIEMSKISTIFLRKTIFLPIFWKISWYFLPVQAAHKHDILTNSKISIKFWYFYRFFLGNFPIFPTGSGCAQGYKICPIFFFKNKRYYLVI